MRWAIGFGGLVALAITVPMVNSWLITREQDRRDAEERARRRRYVRFE